MIECPFCGAEFKSLQSLKIHISKKHSLEVCPVCGKRCKKLGSHAGNKKDEEHQKLYAIIGARRNGNRERITKLRDQLIGVR